MADLITDLTTLAGLTIFTAICVSLLKGIAR